MLHPLHPLCAISSSLHFFPSSILHCPSPLAQALMAAVRKIVFCCTSSLSGFKRHRPSSKNSESGVVVFKCNIQKEDSKLPKLQRATDCFVNCCCSRIASRHFCPAARAPIIVQKEKLSNSNCMRPMRTSTANDCCQFPALSQAFAWSDAFQKKTAGSVLCPRSSVKPSHQRVEGNWTRTFCQLQQSHSLLPLLRTCTSAQDWAHHAQILGERKVSTVFVWDKR